MVVQVMVTLGTGDMSLGTRYWGLKRQVTGWCGETRLNLSTVYPSTSASSSTSSFLYLTSFSFPRGVLSLRDFVESSGIIFRTGRRRRREREEEEEEEECLPCVGDVGEYNTN